MELIAKDLFKADTLTNKAAADVISNFTFNKTQTARIIKQYAKQFSVTQPIEYHKNMIRFVSNVKDANSRNILKRIYLEPGIDQSLQIVVLDELIGNKDVESIAMVKDLLNHAIPQAEYIWTIASIFYPLNSNLELIKPLFPEILNLGVNDTTIIPVSYTHLTLPTIYSV